MTDPPGVVSRCPAPFRRSFFPRCCCRVCCVVLCCIVVFGMSVCVFVGEDILDMVFVVSRSFVSSLFVLRNRRDVFLHLIGRGRNRGKDFSNRGSTIVHTIITIIAARRPTTRTVPPLLRLPRDGRLNC